MKTGLARAKDGEAHSTGAGRDVGLACLEGGQDRPGAWATWAWGRLALSWRAALVVVSSDEEMKREGREPP